MYLLLEKVVELVVGGELDAGDKVVYPERGALEHVGHGAVSEPVGGRV